jgi:microcystin-dependent protein
MTYAQAAGGASTGDIKSIGHDTVETGWLLCDGSAVSRTTYAELFAVIGTVWGIGDGSTTFNLPDMQGRVPVGIGGSGVTSVGDTGGEQTHILTIAEMPNHNHTTTMNRYALSNGTGRAYGTSGSQYGSGMLVENRLTTTCNHMPELNG